MAAQEITKPLISVIIPVYNGALYLKEAIESVLAQSYPSIEIIAVDDGSIDNSAEILRLFLPEIRCFYQQNAGVGAARNFGISVAKGDFISFLDQDDRSPINKFDLLMDELNRSNAMAVMGKTQFVFESQAARQRWPTIPPDGIIFNYLLGAGLFRKEIFDPACTGLFIPEIAPSEDTEWFNRLTKNGTVINKINAVTLYYRQHELNVGNQKALYYKGLAGAMKYIIDQKRRS